MRPLIIDDNIRGKLRGLVEYAEGQVLDMDDLLDTYNGERFPVGDDENYVVHIPVGYRVVYSVELQPVGRIGHLSVSIDNVGKLASVESVKMIINEMGLGGKSHLIKLETLGNGVEVVHVFL